MKKISIIIPIILSLLFVFNACSEKNNFNQYGLKGETTTISSKELYSIAEQGLKRESDYSLEDYKSIEYKYNEKNNEYIVYCSQGDDVLGGDAIIHINAVDFNVEYVEFGE